MAEQMFETGESLDVLELREDFLEMMELSQYMDPFSLSYYDLGADVGASTNNQFQASETNYELDFLNNHNLLIADDLAGSLNSCPGLDVAGFEEGIFALLNDIGSKDDQASNGCPAKIQQQTFSTEKNEYQAPFLPPGKKRKFEDGLSQFMGVKTPSRKTKQRKPFVPERRKEVDQMRKVGACLRCRITKTRCKLDLPCAGCLKLGGAFTLGKALCVRHKLLDARFTADLWGQARDMRWIKNEIPSLHGPQEIIRISAYNLCYASDVAPAAWDDVDWILADDCDWVLSGGQDESWKATKVVAPLEIEVQSFHPRPGKESHHILSTRMTYSIVESSSTTSPSGSQYYAIPESSLPSLKVLEDWALATTKYHRKALVGGFLGSFLSLARRYCECSKVLPLRDLVWKAVRLSCLHGIWRSRLPQPRSSRNEPHRYASTAVSVQIGVIVVKGIVDLEVEILSQLQRLVFDSKGPGKDNMLPIWTCLWLLLLTYRDLSSHWYSLKHSPDGLRELSQHMYDMLVSIYSGLFRPSSPLWLDWSKTEVFDSFGRDHRIIERMGNLKTEMKFCYIEDKGYKNPRDKLLRSLVFEHENKMGQKLTKRPASWDFPVKKYLNFSGTGYQLVQISDGTWRPRDLADPEDWRSMSSSKKPS